MKTFVDTNVFVYAYDNADPVKRERANDVLSAIEPADLMLSAQVLNEFYVVVTCPGRRLLTPEHAHRVVMGLAVTGVEPVDVDLVRRALDLHRARQLSYWDALLVAAAIRGDCARILTEDLAAGSTFQGVLVENPFA